MSEFKVGDRIRVLEVLENGQNYWRECGNIIGRQVCETLPNSDDNCPGVFINQPFGVRINLGINLNQAKHVATIVITKIK